MADGDRPVSVVCRPTHGSVTLLGSLVTATLEPDSHADRINPWQRSVTAGLQEVMGDLVIFPTAMNGRLKYRDTVVMLVFLHVIGYKLFLYKKLSCGLGTAHYQTTNRKLYTSFRLVPLLMTLSDIWRSSPPSPISRKLYRICPHKPKLLTRNQTSDFRWYECWWPWRYFNVINLFHIKFLVRQKLLQSTNRKSYTSFRLVPLLMTLKYIWRSFQPRLSFPRPFQQAFASRGLPAILELLVRYRRLANSSYCDRPTTKDTRAMMTGVLHGSAYLLRCDRKTADSKHSENDRIRYFNSDIAQKMRLSL